MAIKLLQINVGRAYAAQDMAFATAKQMGIDILIVCEPNKRRVNNGSWIKDTRTNVAALILTKNVGIIKHEVFHGHLVLTTKDFSILGCYISPNIPSAEYKMEVDNIMAHVNTQQIVVLGDINAKSTHWASPVTDDKGAYWMGWLSSKDMVVHNKGNSPTFVRGQTRSYIDVTLSTKKIAGSIVNWRVLDQETLTEHKYINFEIHGFGGRKGQYMRSDVGLAANTVNWEVFRNSIRMTAAGNSEVSPDVCTRLIRQAYRSSKCDVSLGTNLPYWWSDSIALKREECNKLRRILTRANKNRGIGQEVLEQHRIAYKTCKKELAKLIMKAKKESWDALCQELDNNIWGDAYQIVAKKLNMLTPYDLCIDKKREIVSDLFPQINDERKWDNAVSAVEPFTTEELESAAKSIKGAKAPGLDKIPPEAIKMVAEDLPEWLLGVINSLLTTQTFPDRWKMARVALILKGGKPPELSSSYRPICMLNTISKLFEILIRNRLNEELDQRGGLHSNQFGFQKGKSTLQAVETVMRSIEEFECRWAVLITIDVRNAFNSARHSLILEEMSRRHFSQYLQNLIASYLSGRKIIIDAAHTVDVGVGVPQGSVLGPTLWNILYNGVLGLQLTANAKTIAFADDLALVVGARNEDVLMNNANKCLSVIGAWMEKHKLNLAPEKTEAVLVRGGRARDHVSFILEGARIQPKKSIKYLGITINNRGTFGQHIVNATARAESKLASLIRVMPNVGGPSSAKRAVLCGAVHSILLYGAPIWKDELSVQKHKNLLIRSQRNILLRVASAYRTVSANALQVITGVLPVDLMVRERAYLHERGIDGKGLRAEARELYLRVWQRRWDEENQNAQWTRTLIRDIKMWINCKHRKLDYHLTQALTGHGTYRFYAKRFGKDVTDECMYCATTDNVEHTIFYCNRWENYRNPAHELLGPLTANNLIPKMVESVTNWQVAHNMIQNIMREKENEERERQRQQQ